MVNPIVLCGQVIKVGARDHALHPRLRLITLPQALSLAIRLYQVCCSNGAREPLLLCEAVASLREGDMAMVFDLPNATQDLTNAIRDKLAAWCYSLAFGHAERKALFTGLAVPIITVSQASGEAVCTTSSEL